MSEAVAECDLKGTAAQEATIAMFFSLTLRLRCGEGQ